MFVGKNLTSSTTHRKEADGSRRAGIVPRSYPRRQDHIQCTNLGTVDKRRRAFVHGVPLLVSVHVQVNRTWTHDDVGEEDEYLIADHERRGNKRPLENQRPATFANRQAIISSPHRALSSTDTDESF